MAKEAGQTFPDFTPPEGETHHQVTFSRLLLLGFISGLSHLKDPAHPRN